MGLKITACKMCSQSFEYDTLEIRYQHYCSPRCRQAAALKLRAERAGNERRCPRCGETKPIEDFPGLVTAYCRPCHATRAREARARRNTVQKDRDRLTQTAWRNGITVTALRELLEAQEGLCAICRADLGGPSGKWHIDHDHSCCTDTHGRGVSKRKRGCGQCVRGILCGQCNVGLGMFRDDPAILQSAIAYLQTVTG